MFRAIFARFTVGALAVAALTVATGPSATARPLPRPAGAVAPVAVTRERAAAAADAHVRTRPTALHAGPDDAFVPGPVVSSKSWQYASYSRTYRGLPVVGGDFVVAVDPAGRVGATSVAQRSAVTGLVTTPTLTRAAAERIAAARLGSTPAIERADLVVYALGAAPRLAWAITVAITVAGTDASRLDVDVDARTGAVLGTRDDVSRGTGNGADNGPVRLDTAYSRGLYWTRSTDLTNLECRAYASDVVLAHTVDAWGDGDPADIETGCVDALYAAETQNRMLDDWLGRNGPDGQGGAWPILVGANINNASYDGSRITVGHSSDGRWLTSLDIIGHEMGHGIDDNTPGGISGGGTKEFIGDVFGTATEWYAGESAPYDVPDYRLGEMVVQPQQQRYMYDPGLSGGSDGAPGIPGCYSSTTSGLEVHAASGPGDHWFYLLAEGTDPTDGQHESYSCDDTTVRGLGIAKATQILYNAMLLKTSNSSYPAYRTWTLTAARNLWKDNCVTYDAVKAAWDAVSVPAQAGEPACTDFSIAQSPTTTVGLGQAYRQALTVSSDLPYTVSASGLPDGVSVDAATGVLSGVPRQPGGYPVHVTVVDSGGTATSMDFALLVKIPGRSGARIATGRTALGWLPVFGTDAGDGVWEYLPGVGGWSRFDGALDGVAVETDADGREELFGVNSAGTVWHRVQVHADQSTALGAWGPWAQLDGALSTIAAAHDADGRIELFGTDDRGEVFRRSQSAPNTSGSWTAWTRLDGPNMVKVAAATNVDGRIALVGLDGRGEMYVRTQFAPGGATGWSPWTSLGGMLVSLAVAADAHGLEVFGTDGSGQIWMRAQAAPGSAVDWTPWTRMYGTLMDIGAASTGGHIEVVGLGVDGRSTYYRYQDVAGDWTNTNWVGLGVETPARIAVPSFMGQTQSAVSTTLTNIGLVAGAFTPLSVNDSSDGGKIVAQFPAAGTVVDAGTTVTFYIGRWNGSRK